MLTLARSTVARSTARHSRALSHEAELALLGLYSIGAMGVMTVAGSVLLHGLESDARRISSLVAAAAPKLAEWIRSTRAPPVARRAPPVARRTPPVARRAPPRR